MNLYIKISLVFSFISLQAKAQDWVEKMKDPSVNFYEVQRSFEAAWKNKSAKKGEGFKQFKRWEYFMEPRVYPSGNRINNKVAWEEFKSFEKFYGKGNTLNKTNSWRPLGPDNWNNFGYSPGIGRINNIEVDPNDSSIIYVGTPSGGCWKSTDSGQNWTPLTDNLPIIGVSDIEVNPLNSNEVYIITGDGFGSDTYSIGLLKSTDGGQSWNNTGLTTYRSQQVYMRRLLLHPNNPNTMWIAANIGLLRSDDGGASWSNIFNGDVRSIKICPNDTSIVYLSTDQFYRSTDGGRTFTSSNNGFNMNQPTNINRMEIAVSPDSANVVYAVCGSEIDASFYGLYRSNDYGQNFTLQSTSPNIFSSDQNGLNNGGQSWYDMAITVNPNNANEVLVGGVNIWHSFDAGTNWNLNAYWVYPSSFNYTHADIHALDFYDGVLYCGSDGGIFRSSDFGSTWEDLSSGLQITQFYRMSHTEQNDTLVLAGAQDNGSLFKTDSSAWAHVFGADGMDNAIDPTNSNIIYYSAQFGSIQRSYDGGITQNNISSSITNQDDGAWVTPFQLDPNNSLGLFAGYEDVWYTPNRGNSWTSISNFNSNSTIRTLKVAPSNSSIIYVCTNSSQIRKTIDGGANWQLINSGLPNLAISDIQLHPTYPDSVWVTFSGYSINNKVFLSGDGGSTWSNISSNLPNLPLNTIAIDSATGIEYVGTDVAIYYRDKTNGSLWQSYMNGLPNVIVNDLEIHYSSQSIRAATYGRGMWEANLIRPNLTSVRNQLIKPHESEYLIFPNPSKGNFVLEDKKQDIVKVRIYNQLGQTVLFKNVNQATLHEFSLNYLKKGLYVMYLETNHGQSKSIKFNLQ